MEKELNYLSCKIYDIEGRLATLRQNKKNYTTQAELIFYVSQFKSMSEEKEIYENILNAINSLIESEQLTKNQK